MANTIIEPVELTFHYGEEESAHDGFSSSTIVLDSIDFSNQSWSRIGKLKELYRGPGGHLSAIIEPHYSDSKETLIWGVSRKLAIEINSKISSGDFYFSVEPKSKKGTDNTSYFSKRDLANYPEPKLRDEINVEQRTPTPNTPLPTAETRTPEITRPPSLTQRLKAKLASPEFKERLEQVVLEAKPIDDLYEAISRFTNERYAPAIERFVERDLQPFLDTTVQNFTEISTDLKNDKRKLAAVAMASVLPLTFAPDSIGLPSPTATSIKIQNVLNQQASEVTSTTIELIVVPIKEAQTPLEIASLTGASTNEIKKAIQASSDSNKILVSAPVWTFANPKNDSFTLQEIATLFGTTPELISSANEVPNDPTIEIDGPIKLVGRVGINLKGSPDLPAIAKDLDLDASQLEQINADTFRNWVVLPTDTVGDYTNEEIELIENSIVEKHELTANEGEDELVIPPPVEQVPLDMAPDFYANQRENPDMGSRPDGRDINSSNTCNMTSLTMVLASLGAIDQATLDSGLPEQTVINKYLEAAAPSGGDITDWYKGIAPTAQAFGMDAKVYPTGRGQEFWDEVKTKIDAGSKFMVSISGHIVVVRDVTPEGVIVDDPAGASALLVKKDGVYSEPSNPSFTNHKHYGFKALNSKDANTPNNPASPGNNNLWPMQDVLEYNNFGTIAEISNPVLNQQRQDAVVAEAARQEVIAEQKASNVPEKAKTTDLAPAPTTTTTVPEPTTTVPAPVASDDVQKAYEALPQWAKDQINAQIDDIKALEDLYLKIEKETGVPASMIAAIHFREGNNNPNQSIFAGEKLGTTNPDTGEVMGTSLEANGIAAAEHLKSMAKGVYGVEVDDDMSLAEKEKAYVAYNRGSMYENAQDHIGDPMDPSESPYASNGLEGDLKKFPDQGHLGSPQSWGEPPSVQGKLDERIGAAALQIGIEAQIPEMSR